MKLIIAGSRTFHNFELLAKEVDLFRSEHPGDYEIISGMAQGADSLGIRYAKENSLPLISMPALWKTFGVSAGYRRNEEMAKIADACICFWDGHSRGTKHMIDLALARGLKLVVVRYDYSSKS